MLNNILSVKYRGPKASIAAEALSPSGQGDSHTNTELQAAHYIVFVRACVCVCIFATCLHQPTHSCFLQTLSKWAPTDISTNISFSTLQFMESVGNNAANAKYEQLVPAFYYRPTNKDCT